MRLPRRLRRSSQYLSFVRSSSIPRSPAFSIYVVSLDFPRFSLAFATSLEFPAFLDFPRFLSTYVVSLDFPRFRRSSGYLSFPRFRRSARSNRSPASSISRVSRWSYCRVLLRHSIGAIAFLDLSCIECLHESFWIKLISRLKKWTLTQVKSNNPFILSIVLLSQGHIPCCLSLVIA